MAIWIRARSGTSVLNSEAAVRKLAAGLQSTRDQMVAVRDAALQQAADANESVQKLLVMLRQRSINCPVCNAREQRSHAPKCWLRRYLPATWRCLQKQSGKKTPPKKSVGRPKSSSILKDDETNEVREKNDDNGHDHDPRGD